MDVLPFAAGFGGVAIRSYDFSVRSFFSDLYIFILSVCEPLQTGCIILLWYGPQSVLLVPVSRRNNNIVTVSWLIFFLSEYYYYRVRRTTTIPIADDPDCYNIMRNINDIVMESSLANKRSPRRNTADLTISSSRSLHGTYR